MESSRQCMVRDTYKSDGDDCRIISNDAYKATKMPFVDQVGPRYPEDNSKGVRFLFKHTKRN